MASPQFRGCKSLWAWNISWAICDACHHLGLGDCKSATCAGYLGHLFRKIENEQTSAQWTCWQLLGQPDKEKASSPCSWEKKRARRTKTSILLRQLLSCAVKSLSLTTIPPFHTWVRNRIGAAEQQKHMVSNLAVSPSAALWSYEWMFALHSSLDHTTFTA